MTNQPSDFGTAAKETAATLTADSWEKMRSVSFAGAGVCTAILLFVLQDSELRQSSALPLFLSCLGLPLLISSAFMVENYVGHGEASYKSLRRPSTFWVMTGAFFLGGAFLVASLFLLIKQFFPLIAGFFLAVCALCLVATMWHHQATKPGA